MTEILDELAAVARAVAREPDTGWKQSASLRWLSGWCPSRAVVSRPVNGPPLWWPATGVRRDPDRLFSSDTQNA